MATAAASTTTISQKSQPPEPNPNSISTTNSDNQAAQDDFLEQMISLPSWAKHGYRSPFSASHKLFPTLPLHNSTINNPNADDASPDDHPRAYDDDSTDSAALASHLRQHRPNGCGRPPLGFLQLNAADLGLGNGCTSPVASCISDANGLPLQMSLGQGGHQDSSLHSQLLVERNRDDIDDPFENNVRGLHNGFHTGRTGANGNPSQHFQNVGMNQTSSSGGKPPAANRLRVRARRGQATDPHSIAERLRRERIAERMKELQELVPNANKTDKASMLDEIIDYVKFLQLQVKCLPKNPSEAPPPEEEEGDGEKVRACHLTRLINDSGLSGSPLSLFWMRKKILSMSRLGAAAAVSPFVADISSAETSGRVGRTSIANGIGSDQGATAATTVASNGLSIAENQVAKLMEEDMGSAMQYLQGKGLCLMPISLASAISTATCHAKNLATTNNNKTTSGSGGISPLTVHSDLGKNSAIDGGEETVKDSTTTKP